MESRWLIVDNGRVLCLVSRLRGGYYGYVFPFLSSPKPSPNLTSFLLGRAALEGTWEDDPSVPSANSDTGTSTFKRASSMIDMMPQSEEEMEAIRYAVVNREGLLVSVFDVLRRVPRRVLMVLKLNDLTR